MAKLRTLPPQEGTDPQRTIESYRWSFTRRVEWADGCPVLELDRADLEDFVDDRMQEASRTAVRKNVMDLKSFTPRGEADPDSGVSPQNQEVVK